MKKIVIATKNKGKLKEIQAMLQSYHIQALDLSQLPSVQEPEETGSTFMDNAILKAKYYAKFHQMTCLADDSGLAVDALNGAPGVFSARYAGEPCNDPDNNKLLLQNMHNITNRHCQFICTLALVDPNGKLLASATGECAGVLLDAPLGENGFGYDPLFFSKDLHKTLAQASMEEKNSVSHRAQALRILQEKLAILVDEL